MLEQYKCGNVNVNVSLAFPTNCTRRLIPLVQLVQTNINRLSSGIWWIALCTIWSYSGGFPAQHPKCFPSSSAIWRIVAWYIEKWFQRSRPKRYTLWLRLGKSSFPL